MVTIQMQVRIPGMLNLWCYCSLHTNQRTLIIGCRGLLVALENS